MLSLAAVRERWASFAGGFVALLLGVAMVSMTALALVSAVPKVPGRYAGAPVMVSVHVIERAEGNFTPSRPWAPETVERLVERLEEVPGVALAVPDRSFYAQPVIGGRPVEADDGHAWSTAALAPYRLASGRAPGAGEVVLDRALGLSPGAEVTVLTARGPSAHRVSGTVDAPGVFMADADVAGLSAGVRAIGLTVEPGADVADVATAARAATGADGVVFTGDARTALEPRDDARSRWIGMQVLTAMGVLSGFVAIFVVASTFAFGVAQRRREFGLLRAVGATPRQVRRMVYGEALAIAVVAAAGGVALGVALGPWLGGLLVTAGFEPAGFTVEVTPLPLLGAFAVGIVVALAGAWSAARRAAGVRPLEALREAAVDDRPMPRGRWIAGGVFCGLGLLAAVGSALSGSEGLVTNGLYAAMALIVGMALLAPALVPPVARLLTWPLARGRGAIGTLVRENALTSVRRTAATATPVLVTVGFAVLITGMVQTTAASYAAEHATEIRTSSVIMPDGVPGLSEAAATSSGGESPLFTALYEADGDALSGLGVTPALLERAGNVRLLSGAPEALRDGSIFVSPRLAAQRGLRPGSTLPGTFEDGRPVSLTVAGVAENLPSDLLLPRDLVRSHDPVVMADVSYVAQPDPSHDVPGSRLVDIPTFAAAADADEDRLVWIFTVLLVVVSTAYAAVAIANTLMMAAAGRARDFAVLRLSGATPRQILTMVTAESALVVILGTALGALVAIPALLGMRHGYQELLGSPVPLVIPWPIILTIITTCLLLATTASILTTRPAT
ncbi:FtsX-like permease family protein [Spongiactinospora sp. TRM90649]|uniref:FtsX-like permease family protein n=1 Tax=Spongiactinospora sp. TRM90649 TaxID=3031114 RepID=UPI0023F7F759|nr:FtsX-like permease family protein [Spongiactinospora sp. TRM90649]MDF5759154.1 FtsX-like permease family protein [Spongiactinospora sp. TRM90649]